MNSFLQNEDIVSGLKTGDLQDFKGMISEAEKLNQILIERVTALEKKVKEADNSKIARLDRGLNKIRFILSTAGGKKHPISKVLFFFTPLGLKLILKFFVKALNYVFKKKKIKVVAADPYQEWLKKNYPTDSQLTINSKAFLDFKLQPKISIIYRVSEVSEFFPETIKSVLKQIYSNFELVIISNEEDYSRIKELVNTFCGNNNSVKIKCGSITEVIPTISGDYIMFLSPEDQLRRDALFHFVESINSNPDSDLLYSDEDHIVRNTFCDPLFKPDWSPDTILSSNYMGKSVLFKVQSIRELAIDFNGVYDLVLRLSEINSNIIHIDKVLYHNSYDVKKINFHFSDLKALETALHRRGMEASIETIDYRIFAVNYKLQDKKKVSIIIPTKDKSEVLEKCLISIFEKTTYSNFEVIIVDNNSSEKSTEELFNSYKKRHRDQFHVHRIEIPFNYSSINNFGVTKASGEYLLFLNNDTEVITSDWLEKMIGQAQRDSIGAVGVKLLYPNRKIQHAGMVIGLEYGGNTFVGEEDTAGGYMDFIKQIRNYSALTAACLMCRKEVFEKVGGFNEEFAVEFNDSDLCLSILEAGYKNVYLSNVELFHYESLSRGYVHLSKASYERHLKEKEMFSQKWKKYLLHDPYYNSNLSKARGGFEI